MSARRSRTARRPLVLVHPASLLMLQALVADRGWEVRVVESAADVLAAAAGSRPAVLVLGGSAIGSDSTAFREVVGSIPTVHLVAREALHDLCDLGDLGVPPAEILTMPIVRSELVLRLTAQLRISELELEVGRLRRKGAGAASSAA